MTNREAVDIIKEESGKKLDPFVVDKFLVLYNKGRFKI
jgi:response regulator RpfG family c-di-GMP phosphodiesterase